MRWDPEGRVPAVRKRECILLLCPERQGREPLKNPLLAFFLPRRRLNISGLALPGVGWDAGQSGDPLSTEQRNCENFLHGDIISE